MTKHVRPPPIAASSLDDPSQSEEVIASLKVYLDQHPIRLQPHQPPWPVVPYLPLPEISAPVRRALEAAALEANERYLQTFVEEHSFCPFSRGGRTQGQTARFVYYADTDAMQPFLDFMIAAARDPSKVVVQVILPLLDVESQDWSRFCYELTSAANARLPENLRASTGGDVFVVAPLHPNLAFTAQNPFSIIPLFRRAPDPTIQWVRIDALEKLYENRSRDTIYVPFDQMEVFLQRPPPKPLFDRIAESNLRMAKRLGIPEVERVLRDLYVSARARYAGVLLSEDSQLTSATHHMGCPFHSNTATTANATMASKPPTAALFQRGDRWAIVRLHDLPQRAPKRFLVDGVELVLVRDHHTVHALYGRCPHRLAPLSDAIVEQDRLVCPHHGWDFRLDSGISEGVPGESVHRFTIAIDEDLVWVGARELSLWRLTHSEAFSADDVIL